MNTSSEMLKVALLGGTPQTSQMLISKLASEAAQEITLHPERDPSQVVADKARTADMNSKQADRLTEETNKKLIQPILRSENKAAQNIKADKKKVRSIIGGETKRPESQYTTTSSGSLVDKDLNATPRRASGLTKSASLMQLSSRNFGAKGDYFDEPQTLENHSLIDDPWSHEMTKQAEMHEAHAEASSERELALAESYVDQGLEDMQGKLARLKEEHMGLCFEFTKIAEQVLNSGGQWLDVVHGTLQVKPDKESCDLLKSAANYLGNRHMIDDPQGWLDALDEYKNGFNGMQKKSGLAVPVSDSLISKSLSGRVRVINGDHQIVKKLRDIHCNERDQRSSIVAIKRLHKFRPKRGLVINRSVV